MPTALKILLAAESRQNCIRD